ncbi:MAG: glycerophosphodiester phosphodiesterase [Burkholderiaceae bacterium]|nr:glycerophosphodiester phosphodiesterase [Burkholderiaceae bacterium]
MKVTYESWPYPRRVAHRGAGLLAPENTLAAMRVGAAHGYRMFEFDAKLAGDGAVVLMHDATLERTTDGRGRVAGVTLGELAKLDAGSWHSAQFAGEGVPTLARAGAWLKANRLMANVEIKPCPGLEAQTGAAVALEARALWRDAPVPPLLSSFSEEALAAAKRAAPELPRALLAHSLPEDWIERCRALDCVAIDANHHVLAAEVVAHAHDAGLRVVCYTVNDPDRAELLDRWGLDCMITDAVDRIDPD